jgi:hypothetical protein
VLDNNRLNIIIESIINDIPYPGYDIPYEEYLLKTISFIDIYTISRSLKTFKNGLPSQLSVIYFGGHHIRNIKYLLDPYYRSVKTFGDINYQVDNPNKCIK